MSPTAISAIVLSLIVLAIVIGYRIPGDRLTSDTKDIVKLSMGLIGTMAALLLGLLVSSAKSSYDAQRTQVTQMAAKASFLDRILALYGPEATDARRQFHAAIAESVRRLWPQEKNVRADLGLNVEAGDPVYFAIEALKPGSEMQQKLKAAAESNVVELAQQRTLLVAQSGSSISTLMLIVVVSWVVMIFAGFSLIAPPNRTAAGALVLSALAVAGAIFLVLELDQPFDGLIRIPNREMVNVLNQIPG
jgi:hypothetical protein